MDNFKYEGIELQRTCGACPEQYDAYFDYGDDEGPQLVGYLRMRHGQFTVEVPYVGGKLVFISHTRGDGTFEVEEREHFLTVACKAIKDEL